MATTKKTEVAVAENDTLALHTNKDRETETVLLFTLDDREYHVEKRARTNVGLKYMWMAKNEGAEMAGVWLLEKLLGEEAFAALMDFDDLSTDDLEAIMEAASTHLLGGLENDK